MNFNNSLTIGNITYKIAFRVDGFHHLCTFRELSDIKLTKETLEPRFNDVSISHKNFTEIEYKIFLKLFKECIINDVIDEVGHKNFLFTTGTGNRSRWSYVIDQIQHLLPFVRMIPVYNTLSLYRKEGPSAGSSQVPGTSEEDGYEELTLFNIHYNDLNDLDTSETDAYIAEQLEQTPAPIEEVQGVTESDIREYLRG